MGKGWGLTGEINKDQPHRTKEGLELGCLWFARNNKKDQPHQNAKESYDVQRVLRCLCLGFAGKNKEDRPCKDFKGSYDVQRVLR